MKSIIVLMEIFIFSLGCIIFSFRSGEKVSEAIAKGFFLCLLIFSFSFQISFLLREPKISFFIETILGFCFLIFLKIKINKVKELFIQIKTFCSTYKITISIIAIVWVYLFLQAVLLAPANWDSMTYGLARILLFQQEKSLFLTQVSLESQAIFPVGSDILHHAFLRFYDDYGIGIFSFISYLIICLGTYALARRYTNQKESLLTTLIIASLPELVLQSTSTKNDIFTAATALFCFILAHRILTKINVEDLILLPIVISFGIACKTVFFAFALPFICWFCFLFFKKYSIKFIFRIIKRYKLYFLLGTFPVLIFFPWLNFYHNYINFGTWQGSIKFMSFHRQHDGIIGTLANLIRYIIQSIDFLEPLEIICQKITGKIFPSEYSITDIIIGFYNKVFDPIFGEKGIMESSLFPIINNNNGHPFFIIRQTGEDYSWFGPFGFFVIIPSIIFALFKGDIYLKMVSFNLIVYALILCNQLAWQPFINRFFSLFFASSGVLIAYLFTKIKLNNFFYKFLTFLTIIIFIYTATFNMGKPLFKNPHEAINLSQFNPLNWAKAVQEKSIWAHGNLGQNRTIYFDINGYPPTGILSKFIPKNSTLALITTHDTWIYHYLLYNPQIKIIPFEIKDPDLLTKINTNKSIDYIFCLDIDCDFIDNINNHKILWNSQEGKEGKIIQILNK